MSAGDVVNLKAARRRVAPSERGVGDIAGRLLACFEEFDVSGIFLRHIAAHRADVRFEDLQQTENLREFSAGRKYSGGLRQLEEPLMEHVGLRGEEVVGQVAQAIVL